MALAFAFGSLTFSLALVAESSISGEEVHEHFQNPGAVNTVAAMQMLMVAGAATVAALTRRQHRSFWLLFAAGFVFFVVDQQWKTLTGSSEQDLHGAIGNYVRDNFWLKEPFILQWSDAIVGAYLALGVLVVSGNREEFLSVRRSASELSLALGFVTLMVLTDSFVVQVPAIKVTEETFKLLAGSFFLGSVTTICGRDGVALLQRSRKRLWGRLEESA